MPNPASYTPTTWVSGSTPADAPELNNIEDGLVALYANTPQTGAANTFLQGQSVSQALSGATKTFFTFVATDGHTFAWQINTSGQLLLKDLTSGVVLYTWDSSGKLIFGNTLSATNQLLDLLQGYGLYSDNSASTFTGGTTRNWWDGPNNGELHLGPRASGNLLAGARIRALVTALDVGTVTNWPILAGAGSAGSGFRIGGGLTGGTIIARFQTGTTGLIVNQGFQFGSGGADMAELYWSDDEELAAGDVVRVVEDAHYGGKIVRCDRDNYPAAFILSTAPASVHGGQLVKVQEERQVFEPRLAPDGTPQVDDQGEPLGTLRTETVTVEEPDSDPHWRPVAMSGRVPVRIAGKRNEYVAGDTFLVSTADGTARPAQEGERPRWLCVSTLADVGKRPLAAGCVLAQLL